MAEVWSDESRLAACETAIAGRQWSGAELARLHVSRAEQYTFSRPRALDKALDDCNAAIAIDPKLAAAYRCRGVVYYERKEFDRAISEQYQALAINPRFAGAYLDRGRAFAAKHDQARAQDFRVSSLVLGIVKSDPFQMRMSR